MGRQILYFLLQCIYLKTFSNIHLQLDEKKKLISNNLEYQI